MVRASGLRWVSLMWLTHIPWANRTWALPVLTALAPSESYHQRMGRPHKQNRVGRIRRDSAVSLLIAALPAAPVLTTSTAAELVGRSLQATSLAVDRLVEAGVLVRVSIGRRNRAFEAHELVDAFTAFERRLASPEGDT